MEVDENEAAGKTGSTSSVSEPINELPLHKRIVEEMIHSINVAADFEDQQQHGTSRNKSVGRRTWVALKLVGCVRSYSLVYIADVDPPKVGYGSKCTSAY